ncbi:hypothetical protein [Neptuniibacter marinus]|uniref:hypothetical protein n=1 Tax=Neptuniibacter marinus TaxID=1806670 RepID=UPI000831951A|nr:hypothetical protein [Neptuniibacter marinus]
MIKKLVWGIILLIVLGIFGAWLTQDYWLPEWNKELAEETQLFQEQGGAFGKENDQQACLEQTLSSFDHCSGFACTVKHGKFLNACLKHAAPSPDFCKDVPAYNEKRSDDDKTWARESCWGRDIRGEGCRLLMRQQQFFCSTQPQ